MIEPSRQFKVPWDKSGKTGRAYEAEERWIDGSKLASQRLGKDDSQKLLKKISGGPARIVSAGKWGLPYGAGYMAGNSQVLYNPAMMISGTHVAGYLTHEGSHMGDLGVQNHESYFTGRHLRTVRRVFGADDARALKQHYRSLGVKYAI